MYCWLLKSVGSSLSTRPSCGGLRCSSSLNCSRVSRLSTSVTRVVVVVPVVTVAGAGFCAYAVPARAMRMGRMILRIVDGSPSLHGNTQGGAGGEQWRVAGYQVSVARTQAG